jgi:hypothetical protein
MGRPRLSQRIQDEMYRLYRRGKSAGEIARALEHDPEGPAKRTVESYLAEWRAIKVPPSPRWSVAEADPADAALILPIIAFGRPSSEPWPTVAHAAWIARLARAMPAFESRPFGPFELFQLSAIYQDRTDRRASTESLDDYLVDIWRTGLADLRTLGGTPIYDGDWPSADQLDVIHKKTMSEAQNKPEGATTALLGGGPLGHGSVRMRVLIARAIARAARGRTWNQGRPAPWKKDLRRLSTRRAPVPDGKPEA